MKKTTLLIVSAAAAILLGTWAYRSQTPSHKARIAIVTLVSHPILDAVQSGCLGELKAQGFDDKNVEFFFANANGQINDTSIIARSTIAQDPNVIVAISTPMAQAVVATKPNCPVVFGAVTDPYGAGLVKRESPQTNGSVSGTSDAVPYEAAVKLIKSVTPHVSRLGVIFNPGESASAYGIKELHKFAKAASIELVEAPVSNSNEVMAAAANLLPRCDALFLSGDNTAVGGVVGAVKVAVENKKPLFVPDSGSVEKGGLAAVSVNYEELGKETGKIVVRMLRGERNIPVFTTSGSDVFVNLAAAEGMGVTVPADVINKAKSVLKETIR